MATACRYQAGPQTILACRTTKGAIGSQLKIAAYTSTHKVATTLVQFLLAAVAQPEKLYLVFLQPSSGTTETLIR